IGGIHRCADDLGHRRAQRRSAERIPRESASRRFREIQSLSLQSTIVALLGLVSSAAIVAAAQTATQTPAPRTVDGVVMRGEAKGPKPITGVRVVLHRVGPDKAGPLDSMLTDAGGKYHFRYVPSGSDEAIYFVSASYDGIAYFSVPLRDQATRGDDAQITVFD